MSAAERRAPRFAVRDALVAALLFVGCASGVAWLQPSLAARTARIKAREDVYVFPPPRELRAATLGYVAAATDLLWAKLLVEYGIHWSEHRPFPDLDRYLDALLALDPTYKPFYEYVDTFLVFRPVHGTEDDARAARAYLEAGIAALPYDPDVWVHYGQFVGFLALTWLESENERNLWREDGAIALGRAAELGADVDKTLVASSVLSRRFGERELAVQFLERAYALTEDETVRRQIILKLQALHAGQEQDRAQHAVEAVEARWRREMPFVSRGEFLLLGPSTDPLTCAGPSARSRPECAMSWEAAVSER